MLRALRSLVLFMLVLAGFADLAPAGARVTSAGASGQDDASFGSARVGHWEGSLVHEDQPYPIVLDVSVRAGVLSVTLDLPEYLVYGSKTDVAVADGNLEITPRMLPDATITLQRQGDRMVGQCEGFWKVTSDAALDRVRDRPVVYVEEELSFTNGNVTLAGTFLAPPGEGPFPTIVWTHGSGPDDRQTFYYSGRAHLLAQHGVASLIYDKRGCGESTGEQPASLQDLIADAIAGIDAIKHRPDVDAAAIGIAGFSQGGWIAPAVAAVDDDVAFVLVGATPAVTGGEQNIHSMKNRMLRDGMSEQTVNEAEELVSRLYRFYQTGEERDQAVAALESARMQPWFDNRWVQNVINVPEDGLPVGRHPDWSPYSPDPMDAWRRVRVPVLSMWGADDIDVPVQLSRDRIEATLTEAGNTRFRLEVFANASHGMWRTGGDGSWDWPRQVQEAHRLMVDWVLEHTSD